MTDSMRLTSRILLAALATGVVGDLLLRAEPWGLNLFLCALILIAAGLTLAYTEGIQLGWEALLLLGTAAGLVAFPVWRAAPPLLALDILGAGVALGLATLGTDGVRVRRAGIYEYLVTAVLAGVDVARSLPELGTREVRAPFPSGSAARRHLRAGAVGVVLSVPLLLAFGGLLSAADAVFDAMVMRVFDFDVENVVSHVAFAGALAWLACGLLRRLLLPRDAIVESLARPPRVSLGALELGVPLGLLSALFLAFVVVQLRYLFGDSSLVETTMGLTYSEYARKGFFELVAVVALVMPLLLLADWAARQTGGSARLIVRILSVLLVVLLAVIIASAVKRMLLYVDAYGLTALRLYTTAFMSWLAAVLGWFCLSVLRGKREGFAGGAVALALYGLVVLNVLNPDALIVRVNVARAAAGEHFDAAYVTELSADAVPELLTSLDRLAPNERCLVAAWLVEGWRDADEHDWRSWNASRARAAREVERHNRSLAAEACPQPAPTE